MRLNKFAALPILTYLIFVTSLGFAQTPLEKLEKLLGAPSQSPALETQSFKPGYLGVIADQENQSANGVQLVTVRPQSPAEKSGIQAGDLITKIGYHKIESIQNMAKALSRVPAGGKVPFELLRNGQKQTIMVTLGSVPVADNSKLKPGDRPKLGVSVVPVTPQVYRDYQLAVESGALILKVNPGTPAAKAGLPTRSVIIAIDGISVRNSDELISLVQGTYPGRPIVVAYVVGNRIYRKTVELYPPPPETRQPATTINIPRSPAASDNALQKKIDTLEEELKKLRGQAGSIEDQLKGLKNDSNKP